MRYISIFIVLFLLLGYNVVGQSLKQNPQLKKGKLANGLTYYIYPNKYPKGEAVYRLFLKSGSVNEEDNQRGLAHFLEHMAFNGTKNFPGNTLVQFLESKGAKFGKDLNAHTSFNETVYKLKLPSTSIGMVDSTLTILADWVNGFELDSTQIEEERGVIFSEWLSKTGAQRDVSNQFLLMLLNNSRYASRMTIGDTSIINNFPHKDLVDYYKSWYRPELMAVAVVGDVDVNVIEKLIKQKFSGIPNIGKSRYKTYEINSYSSPSARILVNKELKKNELNFVQLLPKSKPVKTEKDYLPYLERSFINRLIKSRFAALSFSNSDYKNGSASISNFINTKGVLLASVDLSPDKMEEGIRAFTSHLEQLYQYGFTASEIEKAKKTYLKQLERRATSNNPVASEDIMTELYSDFYTDNIFVTAQEEYRLYKKYFNKIDSISLARNIKRVVDRNKTKYLLTTFNEGSLSFNERELLNLIKGAQSEPVSRYQLNIRSVEALMEDEPKEGSIVSEKSIPQIGATDMLLSNGVRVIFKPSINTKNRINFSAFKMGGLYALDSMDYSNGSFATSVIPLSGVAEFSREEVSQYLAGNSASARFIIEKTRSGIVGGSALTDIETLFQLLYLRSVAAKVDSKVFEQTRNLTIESYRNQNKTEETKFYEDFSNLLVAKDYTRNALTDSIIIQDVKEEKLLPIYNKFFKNANGYTYVLTSDTTLEYLKPFITKYIASLPSVANEKDFSFNYKGGKVKTDEGSLIRSAGSSPRASVSLVFQETNLPVDYLSYELQSTVLENVLKMKLTQVIREKLGLVYSISVNSSSILHPAPLARSTVSFSCQPDKVDFIIENIKEIFSGISNNTLDYSAELENVKKNLLKEFEINKQRDTYWNTIIRNSISNKVADFNIASSYPTEVNNVNKTQLAEVISKNFNTDRMIKAVLLPAENK